MYFLFGEASLRRLREPPQQWESVLAVLTAEEYADAEIPMPMRLPEALSMGEAQYCRLMIEPDRISGRLHIPSFQQQGVCDVLFVWRSDNLLIVDKCGRASQDAAYMAESVKQSIMGPAAFLAEFLATLVSGEPGRIRQLEDRISALEQAVLGDETEQFIDRMSVLRKELNRRGRYYAQLGDMATVLQENASDRFDDAALDRLSCLSRRAEALREETQMLREYASQVSSEYQAQVEISQNRIMKVLTVVTTLFMPLTLIAGWYGMNFQYMPELGWQWGYPAVIGLSVLVVAACLIFFRRRHFW